MRGTTSLVILTAGLVAGPVAASPGVAGVTATQEAESFSWSGRLAAGRTLEVKGINGDVQATGVSGQMAEVRAEKRGRRSDPARVRIEVVEHAAGVTICAVYPDARQDRPNECAPGDRGHLSSRDNDVKVDFTVSVPEGVRFVGQTVNGELDVRGVAGDVVATTVNGDVRASTSGRARASTVNGSITASLGRADWEDELEFSTVNGSIDLELPADTDAEVRARTVNGSLETDFPLTISGRFSARNMHGTIGDGGRRLELSTVNGNIRLRRRG